MKCSIVVSVYNEEMSLRQFHTVLQDVLSGNHIDNEIIFVIDVIFETISLISLSIKPVFNSFPHSGQTIL